MEKEPDSESILAIRNNQVCYRISGENLDIVHKLYELVSEEVKGLDSQGKFFTHVNRKLLGYLSGEEPVKSSEQLEEGNIDEQAATIMALEDELAGANSDINRLQKELSNTKAELAQLKNKQTDFLSFIPNENTKAEILESMKRNKEYGYSKDLETYFMFMYKVCKQNIRKAYF